MHIALAFAKTKLIHKTRRPERDVLYSTKQVKYEDKRIVEFNVSNIKESISRSRNYYSVPMLPSKMAANNMYISVYRSEAMTPEVLNLIFLVPETDCS